ncbi:DNA replication protein [Avibacterium avium]|uniref:DNA replication protein n=1 Tax=Avibacterium avium TaxID=751 RepID=UPI003BF8991B
MNASNVLKLIGRPVAYYKDLSRPLGGATAAILFSQLFYWSDKTDNPLGVYKQLEELCEETGLTLDELRSARKKLVSLGVLIETYKRLEHRLYFKLDLAVFDALILQFGEQAKTDLPKDEKQTSRNGKNQFGEQAKTDFVIDQETTTLDYNNKTPLPPKGESADADNSEMDFAEEKSKKSTALKINYQAIAESWNATNDESGSRLPFVEKINDKRKRAIKKFLAELKEPTLACAENYFAAFFRSAKPHHFGENERGWLANFDFAIRPDVVLRVREGAL